jgi:hypothetical protein
MADFKFCKNCGRKVTLNGQFCAGCGADLGAVTSAGRTSMSPSEETIVGYTSHVFLGSSLLGMPSGVLLFTTDRMVVAKASGKAGLAAFGLIGYTLQVRSKAEKMAGAEIDNLLLENKKNYAIPYSEIRKLRVKQPGSLTKGNVTITTAQGEQIVKISNRGVGVIKDDWEFLKSPPPKLARKLVVE